MSPFDLNTFSAPVLTGPQTVMAPVLPPVVEDFDPFTEKLAFTLPEDDEDAQLELRDLFDGSGVQVLVSGRLLTTLMGCIADDIPEGCLTFEFEED